MTRLILIQRHRLCCNAAILRWILWFRASTFSLWIDKAGQYFFQSWMWRPSFVIIKDLMVEFYRTRRHPKVWCEGDLCQVTDCQCNFPAERSVRVWLVLTISSDEDTGRHSAALRDWDKQGPAQGRATSRQIWSIQHPTHPWCLLHDFRRWSWSSTGPSSWLLFGQQLQLLNQICSFIMLLPYQTRNFKI